MISIDMKKSILFIPASIHSHIIPTMYLADMVKDDYNIYFAVTNTALAEIVHINGFNSVFTGSFRVAVGMESFYIQHFKKKNSRWALLNCILREDIYRHRQAELLELVENIAPDVIIIDIFNSTDFLVLYEKFKNIKYVFLNPMLSTYAEQLMTGAGDSKSNGNTVRKRGRDRNFFNLLDIALNLAETRQLKKIVKRSGVSENHPFFFNKFGRCLFKNIPELILAPSELEYFGNSATDTQHYLGFCIQENGKDKEPDPNFTREFEEIKIKRLNGTRIIYCSFGTYDQQSDALLISFLVRLQDALLNFTDIHLVIAVNGVVKEFFEKTHKKKPNTSIFQYVPQKQVLANADLFVTHGGLGSVKESIFYGVPMLIYPLDLAYDQNDNSEKIIHHKLGMRGVLRIESVVEIRGKLKKMLEDDSFQKNVNTFRSKALLAYGTDDTLFRIRNIFNGHEERKSNEEHLYRS